ncbi:response regulator receiver protein [Desulfocucumis palustris]|uniref:Response regulator receiver protein n=1 Tax=Desulfocucumis palustris TaxID=1898651 RepID=A0A2L2XKN6_9FIRM|nr:CBS domain-containing protein [Desulfocucumis palustris]GBF34491.1 response regulator receiver protein [Desulfocucumis palustris]
MGLPQKQSESVNQIKQEKIVKDLMKPLEFFSTVSADTTVKNAVYILNNSSANDRTATHLLVFENKTLIGIVGTRELLSAIEPPNINPEQWYRGWNLAAWTRPVFLRGLFTSRCLEIADKTVRDIIRPITTTLNESCSLSEAAYQLYKSNRNALPVVGNGLVIGLLRGIDLVGEIGHIMEK